MKELLLKVVSTILTERGVDSEELFQVEMQGIHNLCDLLDKAVETMVSTRLVASMNALADAELPYELKWFKDKLNNLDVIDKNGIPFVDLDLEDHYDGELDM